MNNFKTALATICLVFSITGTCLADDGQNYSACVAKHISIQQCGDYATPGGMFYAIRNLSYPDTCAEGFKHEFIKCYTDMFDKSYRDSYCTQYVSVETAEIIHQLCNQKE